MEKYFKAKKMTIKKSADSAIEELNHTKAQVVFY